MNHIYCGEGKGKTTAAIGLAVRAAGAGKKVYVARFLKSSSSELKSLELLPNVTVAPHPNIMKFVFNMTDEEKAVCKGQMESVFKGAMDSGAEVIILDECCSAVTTGMLDAEAVACAIRALPVGTEVVMTGRDPDPKLVDIADYMTSMEKIRHPFDQGKDARKGIEF